MFVIAIVFSVFVFGQVTNDYRSIGNGDWGSTGSWQRYNGATWVAATVVPTNANAQTITIRNGHTINVKASTTADQLVIESGGTLTFQNNRDLTIANGAGNDFVNNGTITLANGTNLLINTNAVFVNTNTVSITANNSELTIVSSAQVNNSGTITSTRTITNNGILVNSGTITSSGDFNNSGIINNSGTVTNSGTLTNSGNINNTGTYTNTAGSIYIHDQNGGFIPTATWATTSDCNVIGVTNTIPTGFDQTFGNVTWNSTGQNSHLSLAGSLQTVQGNYTINSTGTGSLRLLNASNYYIPITIGGNYVQTGGTLYLYGTAAISGGSVGVSVAGNFSISNGTLNLHGNTDATSSSYLNIQGNINITGGTITETGNGTVQVNCNGTSEQTFSKTAGTISNTINVSILSNAIVNFGTSVLNGSNGNFILESDATIKTGHAQGISTSGASGSVQVTGTRTYTSGANYVYNGTVAQITGNGLTQNTPNNLTIQSTNTVTLSANTSITGNLLIAQGTLHTGANYNISLNGNFTNNGNFVVNSSTVSFIGNTHTYINGSSASAFRNIIINKSATNIQVISNSRAFSSSGHVQVSQGNLVLEAVDDNYIFSNDVTVDTGGILSHNVHWDTSGKLLQIAGNLNILGQFYYSVPRSHVQMIGNNKTIQTGTSSLSILTLQNGPISASGRVEINDNFWAMFGTAGSFSTGGYDVIAHSALLNSGGNLNVNGGSLTVTGGIYVGYIGQNGIMTVSSGTVTTDILSIGGTTETGSYSQSGGTVTVSGQTNLTNGTMSMSFGTFNANGGAQFGTGAFPVVYTQTGGVFNNALNNVELRNATMNISAGAIDVAGLKVGDSSYPSTVNHSAGSVSVFNDNLEIETGSIYTCTNSPTLVLNKDFVQNGTFVPATSTVVLQGTIAQTISGTAPIQLYNCVINNSFGEVSLTTPIFIQYGLDLQNGIITNSDTSVITFLAGVSTSIGNSLSYIQGPVHVQVAAAGSSTLYFPIGKQGDWRPAVLTVTHSDATSYTYASEMFNTSAADKNWTLPTTVDNVSTVRYWTINRFLSTDLNTQVPSDGLVGNQTITLYYDANDGVTDQDNLTICKGTAATGWIDIGGTGASMVSGSVTSTSSPDVFTSFSDFTLGNTNGGDNELPITLSDFSVFVTPQGIEFSWVTETETNNDYFTLQYSYDGITFNSITKVTGAGNSSTQQVYEYVCVNPQFTGLVYIRLQQTDFDGTVSYSEIIPIEVPNSFVDIFVYPNPVSDYIVIQDNANTVVSITMYDVTNKSVALPRISSNTYMVEQLPAGVYTIAIETENRTLYKKIVKQ